MSEYTKEYIAKIYTTLTVLSDGERTKVELVQCPNGTLAVKKTINSPNTVYPQLQTLEHPNLASLLDVTLCENCTIIIEDYISGKSLQQSLDDGYHFSQRDIYDLMVSLCNVLSYLHKHNIIHRDIKPSNIIISGDGVLKLIDFDSSRMYSSA